MAKEINDVEGMKRSIETDAVIIKKEIVCNICKGSWNRQYDVEIHIRSDHCPYKYLHMCTNADCKKTLVKKRDHYFEKNKKKVACTEGYKTVEFPNSRLVMNSDYECPKCAGRYKSSAGLSTHEKNCEALKPVLVKGKAPILEPVVAPGAVPEAAPAAASEEADIDNQCVEYKVNFDEVIEEQEDGEAQLAAAAAITMPYEDVVMIDNKKKLIESIQVELNKMNQLMTLEEKIFKEIRGLIFLNSKNFSSIHNQTTMEDDGDSENLSSVDNSKSKRKRLSENDDHKEKNRAKDDDKSTTTTINSECGDEETSSEPLQEVNKIARIKFHKNN